MSQPEFPPQSLLLFFVFPFNCTKSFLVELWADKGAQKVDLGGLSIYIYGSRSTWGGRECITYQVWC